MKYIKLFEYRKLSVENKEGNKVARNLEHLINKYIGITKDSENYVKVDYNWSWETFKYDFDTYVIIKFIYKDEPKIKAFVDEMIRLSCIDKPEWNNAFKTEAFRNKKICLLTKQQIEELLISLKNGLPFKVLTGKKIDEDKIYTYIDFSRAYKNVIYNDDYITGKLFITNLSKEITINGYDRDNEQAGKNIFNKWCNDMQYLREATPEEEEKYYIQERSKKYNL